MKSCNDTTPIDLSVFKENRTGDKLDQSHPANAVNTVTLNESNEIFDERSMMNMESRENSSTVDLNLTSENGSGEV